MCPKLPSLHMEDLELAFSYFSFLLFLGKVVKMDLEK